MHLIREKSKQYVGNQQGNFGDTDLAWLAGFIDGEGSFGFQQIASPRIRPGERDRSHKRPYFNPRITVGNTDWPTLEYVQGICRAYELPHHVSERHNRGLRLNGIEKPPFWQIRSEGVRRCQKWLFFLMPYLRTKRDQAHVMLEFCESRLGMEGHQKPYTDRELAILSVFRARRSEALTDYTLGRAL